MAISNKLLYGNNVNNNPLPSAIPNPVVKLVGEHKGKRAEFSLNHDILSKHMMLVGGTGCGKTTLFYHIVSQIKKQMTNDDVMIIFDSKGDFVSKFYSPQDAIIGNSKMYASKSEHWNIFKEILADGWEEKDFTMNVREICKSFFEERTKKTSNAFFPNAASDLLASLLIAEIRAGIEERDQIEELFYNDALKQFLDGCDADLMVDILSDYDDLNSVKSYIAGGNEQSQGVISELFSVTREIFQGVFAEKGKFSIRDFVRKKSKRTLFIEYDLAIGNVLTPVYRLMFDLALKEALGRTKSQGNVYLICDEFRLIPHLQHIDDGVNFGRSLGVKIIAGLQSVEQLYEMYGESRGKNIAAGFSSLFAFRANDATTRKHVKELFGQNIILDQYQMSNNTIVEEKRTGNTVEDWDLNTLKVGEAIVGLPFSQPFRFYFDMYR